MLNLAEFLVKHGKRLVYTFLLNNRSRFSIFQAVGFNELVYVLCAGVLVEGLLLTSSN